MATELAPGFLVAAPMLLDPNFQRTVVLLVEHRPEASLGFVINRPTPARLPSMLDALGLQSPDARPPDSPVLVGGPVAPDTGWIVFEASDEHSFGEVVRVSPKLAVSASRELLETTVQGRGPERMMLVLGYAGWGPSQLDAEIAQGAWIPVDLDEKIVFDTPFDDRWAAALQSLGIDPGRLTSVPPSES
ncbi:MAG TPA: YqgE/AlgH family protein [Polyangiales bacterium]|jgi:putative transcriptional regulator